MTDYTVAEARNHFTKLLQRVEAGEDVTITRRGKVIARIVLPPQTQGMSIDLDWLEGVRVQTSDPNLDFTKIIREMRDEKY